MSHLDIIRAWKDAEYRNSLSAEQLSQLPEHPAGMSALSDEVLKDIAGGFAANRGTGCGTGGNCSVCGANCTAKN